MVAEDLVRRVAPSCTGDFCVLLPDVDERAWSVARVQGRKTSTNTGCLGTFLGLALLEGFDHLLESCRLYSPIKVELANRHFLLAKLDLTGIYFYCLPCRLVDESDHHAGTDLSLRQVCPLIDEGALGGQSRINARTLGPLLCLPVHLGIAVVVSLAAVQDIVKRRL